MKVKVNELTGLVLDYAVAKCEGGTDFIYDTVATYWITINGKDRALSKGWAQSFTPSTSWEQAGPIIEREKINLHFCCDLRDVNGKYIHASMNTNLYHGYCKGHDTPLVAAMRCYVASKMGEEVEIPEELCQG